MGTRYDPSEPASNIDNSKHNLRQLLTPTIIMLTRIKLSAALRSVLLLLLLNPIHVSAIPIGSGVVLDGRALTLPSLAVVGNRRQPI